MGSDVKIDGLREALEGILRERVKGAATKIADELTKFAEHSILGFYDHYQPVKYRRQGGLRGSYVRYYRNPHNKIYHGGVEIQPGSGSYTSRSGLSVSSEWITALAVFNGMHGNVEAFPRIPKTVPPRMTPPPFELIEKKRDEIIGNIDSYING